MARWIYEYVTWIFLRFGFAVPIAALQGLAGGDDGRAGASTPRDVPDRRIPGGGLRESTAQMSIHVRAFVRVGSQSPAFAAAGTPSMGFLIGDLALSERGSSASRKPGAVLGGRCALFCLAVSQAGADRMPRLRYDGVSLLQRFSLSRIGQLRWAAGEVCARHQTYFSECVLCLFNPFPVLALQIVRKRFGRVAVGMGFGVNRSRL